MRRRTPPLEDWNPADDVGGRVQLDYYDVDRALTDLAPDARRVTVSTAAPVAKDTLGRLCQAIGRRPWQLLVKPRYGGPLTTGIRDLAWVDEIPNLYRLMIEDPVLQTLPGLSDTARQTLQYVMLRQLQGPVDIASIARAVRGVPALALMSYKRFDVDLSLFADHGAPFTLMLGKAKVRVGASRAPVGMVGMSLHDQCVIEAGAEVATALSALGRLMVVAPWRTQSLAWLDEAPGLDWVELRALTRLDSVPRFAASDGVRVLRLRENRALRDLGAIAQMPGLRELGILACPKIEVASLAAAENLGQLERWCIDVPPEALGPIVGRLPGPEIGYYDDLEGF